MQNLYLLLYVTIGDRKPARGNDSNDQKIRKYIKKNGKRICKSAILSIFLLDIKFWARLFNQVKDFCKGQKFRLPKYSCGAVLYLLKCRNETNKWRANFNFKSRRESDASGIRRSHLNFTPSLYLFCWADRGWTVNDTVGVFSRLRGGNADGVC